MSSPQLCTTLYHNLDLDARRDRILGGSGTPRYPIDPSSELIRELIEWLSSARLLVNELEALFCIPH